MPEHIEAEKKGGVDPEVFEKIRAEFADELEKRSTQSSNWRKFLGNDIGERVVCGEGARRTLTTENLVIDLGRRLKLSEEAIDELKKLLLEEEHATGK